MTSSSDASLLTRLKPYLRWLVLGGTLFFLTTTLNRHWQEVVSLRIEAIGWLWLGLALGVTLVAHGWGGWVWGWILRELGQSVGGGWAVSVYLQTNLGKYLPGNVWHLYGRVMATQRAGYGMGVATLSVLLEPLLMAAAALSLCLGERSIAALGAGATGNWLLPSLSWGLVMAALHPRVMNLLLQQGQRLKGKALPENSQPCPPPISAPPQLQRYPLGPLAGEMGFVLLRGIGFVLTLQGFMPVEPGQLPLLLSAFSFAWLLGLVVPGAPGGMGVFEATAIALLNQVFSAGVILGGVALYRVVSILAEALGAGLAWLGSPKHPRSPHSPS